MKTEELRELDAEELGGRLKGARRELYELRFKLAVGQLDNHREIRKARKEIARILTVVHQRRIEAVDGEPFEVTPAADAPEAIEETAVESAAEPEGTVEDAEAPSAAAEVGTGETEDTDEGEVPEATDAPADVEPGTPASGTEGAVAEETDAEAGPARRRRGRRAGNEDEG
jgi:large subunit ribosomal protein L29